jgi:phage terminase small subunit
MALTPKQERFIHEYLVDCNGTQAAIRAGYSPKTANEQASRLLTNVSICEIVKQEQEKRAGKVGLDAEWVLRRLKDISDRCMQEEPVLDHRGQPTGEYRFDSSGANKSTELIGKHLAMFTDKVDVSGSTVIFKGEKDLED